MRGQGSEFVCRRPEGQASDIGDFLRGLFGKARRSIQSRAHSGASDGQFIDGREGELDELECIDPIGRHSLESRPKVSGTASIRCSGVFQHHVEFRIIERG